MKVNKKETLALLEKLTAQSLDIKERMYELLDTTCVIAIRRIDKRKSFDKLVIAISEGEGSTLEFKKGDYLHTLRYTKPKKSKLTDIQKGLVRDEALIQMLIDYWEWSITYRETIKFESSKALGIEIESM